MPHTVCFYKLVKNLVAYLCNFMHLCAVVYYIVQSVVCKFFKNDDIISAQRVTRINTSHYRCYLWHIVELEFIHFNSFLLYSIFTELFKTLLMVLKGLRITKVKAFYFSYPRTLYMLLLLF